MFGSLRRVLSSSLFVRPRRRGHRVLATPTNVQRIREEIDLKGIECPEYANNGHPAKLSIKEALVHDQESVSRLRRSCQLAKFILKQTESLASTTPGTTTQDINDLVNELCLKYKAYPSPLNYRGFPKSVCVSINNIVCHGIPDSSTRLESGDVVSIDVSVFRERMHGDCATTLIVDEALDAEAVRLVHVARTGLQVGINSCKANVPFKLIGKSIESYVEQQEGLKVVQCFAGHGIGPFFHGPPDIFHVDNDYRGVMRAGNVFTIEPIVSESSRRIFIAEDNWTALSSDGGRGAQFEETILITEEGHQVLTQLQDGEEVQ